MEHPHLLLIQAWATRPVSRVERNAKNAPLTLSFPNERSSTLLWQREERIECINKAGAVLHWTMAASRQLSIDRYGSQFLLLARLSGLLLKFCSG
jgi:hypothetical protein